MTENSKQEKRNLIPIPLQRAFYAGLAAGGGSYVLGVPPEYTPRVALAGACYSLFVSWGELGGRKIRKQRGRQITVNGIGGERKVSLEYSVNGGHILRETWGDTLTRWLLGKPRPAPMIRENKPAPRPKELDEFMFHSRGIQLRESHVKLFLASAYRNRKYGSGMSERRWVREFSQRPAWYQELSTDWYYAMMGLLFDTQANLKNSDGQHIQMVIVNKSNNWMDLANEPDLTLTYLKYYERQRRRR